MNGSTNLVLKIRIVARFVRRDAETIEHELNLAISGVHETSVI
jgi:hypothetical protein